MRGRAPPPLKVFEAVSENALPPRKARLLQHELRRTLSAVRLAAFLAGFPLAPADGVFGLDLRDLPIDLCLRLRELTCGRRRFTAA